MKTMLRDCSRTVQIVETVLRSQLHKSSENVQAFFHGRTSHECRSPVGAFYFEKKSKKKREALPFIPCKIKCYPPVILEVRVLVPGKTSKHQGPPRMQCGSMSLAV